MSAPGEPRKYAAKKRGITFRISDALVDRPLEIPCGRCIGCVQDRANAWALRCEHEAKLHRYNWFITLTYDEAHLPPGGSLRKRDLQLFWKRLRKEGSGVRYFACGEYGENFERPHYHVLAFNLELADMTRRTRADGQMLFESKRLTSLWGNGSVQVDLFTPARAQYVTNYILKAAAPPSPSLPAFSSLPVVNSVTAREKAFQVMSRRPGIGSGFISRFFGDVYPDGFVTLPGGKIRRAPRFYDDACKRLHPRMYRAVSRRRAAAAAANPEAVGKRLLIREAVDAARKKFYDQVNGRPFEKGDSP